MFVLVYSIKIRIIIVMYREHNVTWLWA